MTDRDKKYLRRSVIFSLILLLALSPVAIIGHFAHPIAMIPMAFLLGFVLAGVVEEE